MADCIFAAINFGVIGIHCILCYRLRIALKDTIKAKAVMTDPVSGVKMMIGMDFELVSDNFCRRYYIVDVRDLTFTVWFRFQSQTPLDASQVFNMRLQEQEFKGGFSTKNLFYLSISWMSKDTFGHARLAREVTDGWVQKRFKHAGQEFTCDPPELTNQEIESVPGGKAALGRLDEIKFEVLERTAGDKMNIRMDEHKFWSSQGGDIQDTYNRLREQHLELVGHQATINVPGPAQAESSEPPAAQPGGEETPSPGATIMESLAKLEERIGVDCKAGSEVGSVDLLLGKDGSIWLLSSQDKTVAKHTLLGGFGTGQWIADSDNDPGVAFDVSLGDKTVVQLDESSFTAEGQGIATMSLFKLLVRAEKEKGLTEHRVSFLNIKRKDDLDAGQDGFEIKLKSPMKFRCIKDPRSGGEGAQERISCKNFFAKAVGVIQSSQFVMKVFRLRYEKVGQNFKIQRPYIVTKKGFTLKKDCPLKICGNNDG